jgi:hypothetical protein
MSSYKNQNAAAAAKISVLAFSSAGVMAVAGFGLLPFAAVGLGVAAMNAFNKALPDKRRGNNRRRKN